MTVWAAPRAASMRRPASNTGSHKHCRRLAQRTINSHRGLRACKCSNANAQVVSDGPRTRAVDHADALKHPHNEQPGHEPCQLPSVLLIKLCSRWTQCCCQSHRCLGLSLQRVPAVDGKTTLRVAEPAFLAFATALAAAIARCWFRCCWWSLRSCCTLATRESHTQPGYTCGGCFVLCMGCDDPE
jgi:hypothetical protein